MINTVLAAALITASMATAPAPEPAEHWENIGQYRITTYDIYCNEPAGRDTASGKRLEYGQVAMNNVPFGTKIAIDGEVFEVTDRCAFDDTVDIFIETDKGYCDCNFLEYKEVMMKCENNGETSEDLKDYIKLVTTAE